MNRIKKYFAPLVAGAIVLSLSSCNLPSISRKTNQAASPTPEATNPPLPNQLDSNPSSPTPSPSPTSQVDSDDSTSAQPETKTPDETQASNAPSSKANSSTQSSKTVALTIYQADTQCQALVPEKVAVPAGSPADAAVGKVLEKAESGDFDLAGYRVNINSKSGVATVDLRLAPDSQRQFASLSACEQFALFGSLRKTLTDNSQLKIKDVRFTEQGQEIVL